MSCCSGTNFKAREINGECPECGNDTVDGDAFEQCGHSPTQCDTCGDAPCDLSC
jgi:hypothetical protein